MEMYTIQEFAELCGGISYNGADKKIDGLIKKVQLGKLNGEIERKEKLIDGKLTKVVLISNDLLDLVKKNKKELNLANSNQVEQDYIEPNVINLKKLNELNDIKSSSIEQLNTTKSNHLSPAFVENVINELITTQKQMINYAEQAGQVKLLEDIERRKENEYLRQMAEYKTIIASLEKENQEFKLQLEQERNKPFWKKKVL